MRDGETQTVDSADLRCHSDRRRGHCSPVAIRGTCRLAVATWAEGPSSYDYDTDTLCWNQASAADAQSPNHHPWQSDPLTALAHELNHPWHDLCRNGDGAGPDQWQQLAFLAENRIRHALYLRTQPVRKFVPRHDTAAPRAHQSRRGGAIGGG